MASLVNKRLCIQKPIQNTLIDELRVIKNLVDFRISAVESKLDLLIATCSSIFNNSELLCSQYKDRSTGFNRISEQFLLKIRDVEELISALAVSVERSSCKNCCSNRETNSNNNEKVDDVLINASNEIKLNSADDFPYGSWLGDESDPKRRVRVNLDPSVVLYLNEQCTTPEKMAHALIDKLFPRDVLAVSNLSGKGRRCKQQLNPLLIYGVKCHLKYKFNLSDSDWYRIKKNIDSKCRTIWRRKKRGLLLGNQNVNCTALDLSLNQPNDFESSDDCTEQVVCYEVLDSKVTDIALDEDIQLPECKPPSEDEFQLLPSVQLFTVEATDCFMLEGNELIIPNNIIKDVDEHHDFLNK